MLDIIYYSLPFQIEFLAFGLLCFIPIIPFILQLVIAYWMYKDAKKRGEEEVLWLLVGLVGGVVGLIIWLIVRPNVSRRKRDYLKQSWKNSSPNLKRRPYRPKSRKKQSLYSPPPPPQQESSERQKLECEVCGREMRYIVEYERWYCDSCRSYR